ncbi:MAG: response regulator [Desulfobacterales bacterium]|jgi:two-component system chemotaxis response regulator CheY|nr:response regulator [Desulfobacterales bacterium]MDD3082001.1 response regulator [Desulfobacterales bacterium]MDD3949765.1 response regulator [Desulfobacterales bacterium]MDD4463278.1 response regulator [Desulfobacterales bacterium]MDY0377846.1 response regulator [Desulfobacterales bacterium]
MLILMVDDSPTIRSSVSFCIQNAGYKVIEAVDGQDGLERLEEMKKQGIAPSLIITDVNMPRMDGMTFIENVKKSEFRYLPIMVLTTESEEWLIEKGRALGASGWLLKPFQPEELLWAIKKLVWER